MRWDAPLVHLLQSTNLVGFEPKRFSLNLRDEIAPFDGPIDNDSRDVRAVEKFSSPERVLDRGENFSFPMVDNWTDWPMTGKGVDSESAVETHQTHDK